MPWFARERAIEMDEDLRRRVVEDPAFALAMPLEDVARVESAAAEPRRSIVARERRVRARGGVLRLGAARAGARSRDARRWTPSARRRKRIELRLRLGDARAGANEPGRACGAYAAALRAARVDREEARESARGRRE